MRDSSSDLSPRSGWLLLPLLVAGELLFSPALMPAAGGAVARTAPGWQDATPQEAGMEGQWSGAIETPGAALEVVVDLAGTADSWTGQIDIPAQGVEDRELGGVEASGDSVRFEISGISGSPVFRGELTAGGDSLVGRFSQGGQSFPFRLARSGPPEIAEGPDPAEALAGFDETVEAARDSFRVPGAAVAVVKDGEVALARGYGIRDRETGAVVTDSTLFPIGSMTKSFTSLLVAALVEEGELAWDEPVQRWLPEFRLARRYASSHATPVDLLSHRTGLPRHELLWLAWEEADTAVTRADYIRAFRHLPFSAEFRTEFQYNNFMYMAAGHLVGRTTDSSWEAQLRQRLLDPLGMRRTTSRVDSLRARPDRAAGYRLVRPDSGEARLEPMDYFRIDAMSPAGAINSSAAEMARWLELHAQEGEVDGERVAPAAAVERTHRPVLPLASGGQLDLPEVSHASYALGWQVHDYRGHRMLVHGGGIDGFTALMAVLPEEEVGVAVLSNRLGGRFTTAVTLDAVDRMLGLERKDWVERFRQQAEQARQAGASGEADTAREGDTGPRHPLAEFAGSYRHPGYGTMRVTTRNDSLVARLGELTMDLEHRHFDVFDGRAANPLLAGSSFAFQFQTGRDGHVAALTVPIESSVTPLRFERLSPERLRDPDFLRKLTGEYRVAGMTVQVRLRGEHTLVFEQPGASAELVPERGTRFQLEGQEGTTVAFEMEEGRAAAIVIRQGGRRFEGPRK